MDRKVVERFHHAAIRLLRALRAVDEAGGFSGRRAPALSGLVFRGPQSLAGLAAAEGVKPHTMSRLVTAMEAEGLVEAASSAHDQRQITIRASARGKQRLLAARERRLAAIAKMIEGASAAEAAALRTVTDMLERSLDAKETR